jgi:hypothetical protein
LLGATLGACDDDPLVVVPPPDDNRLFVTWEVRSAASGFAIDCPPGSTVAMDAFDQVTGEVITTFFDCLAYEGTSQALRDSGYDVLLDLIDLRGFVLSETQLQADTLGTIGTIDIGHVIFTIP